MKRVLRTVFLIGWAVSAGVPAFADSVLLKNGRRVTGIVVSREGDPNVVLEVGSGTMILAPDEVAVITRSAEEERQAMRSDWLKRKLDTEAAFQLGLTHERIRSAEEVKLEALKPKRASLTKINGHLYVDVAVNERPTSRFLLDTGAPSIILTRKTAELLGIDLQKKWPTGTANVAGQKIPCFYVKLDKVDVEGFWALDIEALVYRVEGTEWVYNQDILGMSFLEHFHFEINVKKSILTLSWGQAS